ncbi:MAG TPA: hypothetical protein VHX38_26240 [Pseudonocardiaceae bacterium]|jgi:hypothetical protein|nr:hypothetical protein [Pseudonocardiaceae bacterium]
MDNAIRTGLNKVGEALHDGLEQLENATRSAIGHPAKNQAGADSVDDPQDCGPMHCEDEQAPVQA